MTSQALAPIRFEVLALIDGKTPGRVIREGLTGKRSLPSFYQLMARLEEDGLVRGEYERKLVEGQPIKERFYERTAKGERAVEETRRFYAA